jgi:glycosyltransferase involved in cell wall biosynthesis
MVQISEGREALSMRNKTRMRNGDYEPLISVIVPIYNTASYLERCLKSIVDQTYDKLEIICIDDGSTDGSELILDEFARKDSRIRVIHKQNGGESSARNVGLEMMTGQYIGFLDCDDWIEANMYERLVSIAIQKDVDMVASPWFKDTDEESIKIGNQLPVSPEIFEREDLLQYIYKRDYYRGFTYMWNKLYRRSLFYDERGEIILFDEDLALGGDVLYLGRLALNTEKAVYLDEAFYHYYQRDTSGCHTVDLNKRKDWLEAYKRLIRYIEDQGIKTDALVWIKRFLAYHSSNVAELAYEQKNYKVLRECQEIMLKYSKEYCETNKKYEDRIVRFEKLLRLVIE